MSVDWARLLSDWGLAAHEARLRQFLADLIRFNRGRNLVSRAAGDEHAAVLVLEAVSAAWALAAPPGTRFLDLGSGAGLPGIPMAIVSPNARIDLLERRATRCDFLRRECRVLPVENACVLEGDAKVLGGRGPHAGAYDAVLLKAVAQPAAALALAAPFLLPSGAAILFARAGGPAGVGDQQSTGRPIPTGWRLERALPLGPIAKDRPAGALLLLRPDVASSPADGDGRSPSATR